MLPEHQSALDLLPDHQSALDLLPYHQSALDNLTVSNFLLVTTVQVDIRSGFLMKNYIVYTTIRIYDMSIENKCLQNFQIKLNRMIITFDYNHHFLVDRKRKGKIIDSMNLIQRLMPTWWTNHWSKIDKIIFLMYFDGLLRYLIHRF